jgi:3-oxoacyl-[acyl-carrier-protein] synthase-3
MIRSVITGTGSALPVRRVSNAQLAEQVDTSDEWIVERTGIRFRHIAGEGETTATLAADACRAALAAAGVDAQDIDLIVLATATPDQTFPASATKVQAMLGIDDCVAFDVAAVCSGFLYAVQVVDSMIRSGVAKRALVIGAETFSRILDWEDRTTCVLFGDGAGAIVLEAQDTADADGRGILTTKLHADGRHNQLLYVDGGVSTTGTVGKLSDQPCRRHDRIAGDGGLVRGPGRLGRAAPGECPDPRRDRAQAGPCPRARRRHRRPACQHLRGVGTARARRGGP